MTLTLEKSILAGLQMLSTPPKHPGKNLVHPSDEIGKPERILVCTGTHAQAHLYHLTLLCPLERAEGLRDDNEFPQAR